MAQAITRIGSRAAALTVAAVAMLAGSCGDGGGVRPPQVDVRGFPLTVERADGVSLTFDAPPQRIVSLSPGHTEILFAIGAGEQIVAVDTGSDFPAEAVAKTKLDATNPDLEALDGLAPDLVVVMGGPEELVKALDERQIPALLLELPVFIEDILGQIDLLGGINGLRAQSDALVDEMDSRTVEVLNEVEATIGPRVYHEIDEELTTASVETFIGELYEILTSENIAGRTDEPFPRLTPEDVIAANPEVIIVAHEGTTVESVKARPGWQDIDAVKNDRVYAVDPDIVNRPGPRLVDGLETLANLLLPDLFPEP